MNFLLILHEAVIQPGQATAPPVQPMPSPSPSAPGFGAGIVTFSFLLSLLVWGPVVVAVIVAVLPLARRHLERVRWIAFWTMVAALLLTLGAYGQAQLYSPSFQFEENAAWMPFIGVRYHLGVDGVTIPLLMMSQIVGLAAVLASFRQHERPKAFFVLLLLAQGAINGVLASRDLFMVVLFWGAAVIPLTLIVGGWTTGHRGAAGRFAAYGAVGTAALAAAVLVLHGATGGASFDMDVLLKAPLPARVEVVVAVLFVIAAATRLPLVPLHGWVRDVVANAPAGVAVLVVGSFARLGGYVLIRLMVGALHAGSGLIAPFVAAIAVLTIVYAALAAIRNDDIRRFGAYASLIPGAIVVLGVAGLTPLSVLGATFEVFAGGLAAALLVGACATISDRTQARSIVMMGGLAPRMPKLTWLLVLGCMAVLGLPGFASFIANLFTLEGSFHNQPAASFAVLAGLAVTAAVMAVAVQRMVFGAPRPDTPGVSDADLPELWYLGLLAGCLIWWGLLPGGPKLGGTVPIIDQGIVNVINNSTADFASTYAPKV